MIHTIMKSALLLAGLPNAQHNQSEVTGGFCGAALCLTSKHSFYLFATDLSADSTNDGGILIDVYGM